MKLFKCLTFFLATTQACLPAIVPVAVITSVEVGNLAIGFVGAISGLVSSALAIVDLTKSRRRRGAGAMNRIDMDGTNQEKDFHY